MHPPLVPAEPAVAGDGSPYSAIYDDIYHSAYGGLAQARPCAALQVDHPVLARTVAADRSRQQMWCVAFAPRRRAAGFDLAGHVLLHWAMLYRPSSVVKAR